MSFYKRQLHFRLKEEDVSKKEIIEKMAKEVEEVMGYMWNICMIIATHLYSKGIRTADGFEIAEVRDELST